MSGVKFFLALISLAGCTLNSGQTQVSFTVTDDNVNQVMPQYFDTFRAAVLNKTPIPKLEGQYFASGAYNVPASDAKAAAEDSGEENVAVFNPVISGGGTQGATRGVISFTQSVDKCCFFCGQFGGGICSNCKASECRFGSGWICGEVANSCNPNLCTLAAQRGLLTGCLF